MTTYYYIATTKTTIKGEVDIPWGHSYCNNKLSSKIDVFLKKNEKKKRHRLFTTLIATKLNSYFVVLLNLNASK